MRICNRFANTSDIVEKMGDNIYDEIEIEVRILPS